MEIISERLGLSENFLWHAYSLSRSGKGYTAFEIPKRSGGFRNIHKPVDKLFYVQSLIKCNILDSAPSPPDCVTAFRKGFSIRDNALIHCKKVILVKFDLKDFFPSISFTRVKTIFEELGFHESDAKGLAYLTTIQTDSIDNIFSESALVYFQQQRINNITDEFINHIRSEASQKRSAMHEGLDFGDLGWEADCLLEEADRIDKERKIRPLKRRGLPQGAPTSPQLANLAARRLDARLQGLAEHLGFQYTRYADDLTFSSNDTRAKTNVLRRLVELIVKDCGFTINPSKTSFMRAPATRQTTGLIVNDDRPRVRRSTIRRVRAMIHQERLGILAQDQSVRLKGYLSFIKMVNADQAKKLELGLLKK